MVIVKRTSVQLQHCEERLLRHLHVSNLLHALLDVALRRLLDYQLSNGVDFLCILATTGETPCLTSEEKSKIKELVVEKVNGRIP